MGFLLANRALYTETIAFFYESNRITVLPYRYSPNVVLMEHIRHPPLGEE